RCQPSGSPVCRKSRRKAPLWRQRGVRRVAGPPARHPSTRTKRCPHPRERPSIHRGRPPNSPTRPGSKFGSGLRPCHPTNTSELTDLPRLRSFCLSGGFEAKRRLCPCVPADARLFIPHQNSEEGAMNGQEAITTSGGLAIDPKAIDVLRSRLLGEVLLPGDT